MGSERMSVESEEWVRKTRTNRRRFLVAAGSLTVAVAGCLGGDGGSDPSYEDGEVGTVDGDERTPEEATAAEAHAETESVDAVTVIDGLEMEDHEFVFEDGFAGSTVQGAVENVGDGRVETVEVRVRVYNDAGRQLGQYLARTGDLDAGAVWDFQVILLEAPSDIAGYDIAVLGTPT